MAGTESAEFELLCGKCQEVRAVAVEFVRHFDRKKEEVWKQAVDGTLNRATCKTCGAVLPVDHPFLYTDLELGLAVVVLPVGATDNGDIGRSGLDPRVLHIGKVHGLERFREMLWMHEHGIGRAALGEFKRHLIVSRPDFDAQVDIQLVWTDGAEGQVVLRGLADDGSLTTLELQAPIGDLKAVQSELISARMALETKRGRRRRFIGTQTPLIVACLEAKDEAQAAIFGDDRTALIKAFQDNDHSACSADAVAKLVTLFPEQAHAAGELFEDATGIALSTDLIARLSEDDDAVATLWRSFGQLPAPLRKRSALSLEEIRLNTAMVGNVAAYVPDDSVRDSDRVDLSFGIIQSEDFAHALRHELAHAIHDRCKKQVDDWLRSEFGWSWHMLPKSWVTAPDDFQKIIDTWIGELGGWETACPGATTDEQRRAHGQMIWLACQPGAATGGVLRSHLADHPLDQPAWFGESAARTILKRAPADWWKVSEGWLKIPVGAADQTRLAVMNYKYSELVTLDISARDLVLSGVLWNKFALMSHREFFAEFYATWYDPDTKLREAYPGFDMFLSELVPA